MGWADKFKRTDSGKGLILNPTPPPSTAKDHSGHVLHPGDEVLTSAPQTFWRVREILPVMDPGMPAGLVRVRMVAMADAVVPAGERLEGLHRLRTAAELGEGLVPPAETTAVDKPTTLMVD